MPADPDDGAERVGPDRRTSLRLALAAEITVWRPAKHKYFAHVEDLSMEGCKTRSLDRPLVNERALVKFEGLEPLGGTVQWVLEDFAGIRFDHPIHPAVFDLLLAKSRSPSAR